MLPMGHALVCLAFLVHLSLSFSHPLPSAHALLFLSPSTLLASLTPSFNRNRITPGISQSLSQNYLHLTLPPLPINRLHVSATLLQPSRMLHVVLQPKCAVHTCPPDVTHVLHLAAPVDSATRVRILLSRVLHNSTAVRLDLTLLEPALHAAVERCAGGRACLAHEVRKRCGRTWNLSRCGPQCVVDTMRRCVGEVRGVERWAKLVFGLFLAAASAAVLMVFVFGMCVAVLTLPGEMMAGVNEIIDFFAKRNGS